MDALTATASTLPTLPAKGHTADAYNRAIARFNETAQGPVTVDAIAAHLADLKAQGFAPSTVAVAKAALKKSVLVALPALAATVDGRARLDAAWREIKTERPRLAPSSADCLSRDTVAALAVAAGPRWGLFIRTLYATGARVSELLTARARDCRRSGATVFIQLTGKGNKRREVQIGAELFADIRNAFDGPLLFTSPTGRAYARKTAWEAIAKAGKAIGLAVHPHTLRHSLATNLVELGEPINAVSSYLGHADVTTTARFYLHSRPNAARLAAVAV